MLDLGNDNKSLAKLSYAIFVSLNHTFGIQSSSITELGALLRLVLQYHYPSVSSAMESKGIDVAAEAIEICSSFLCGIVTSPAIYKLWDEIVVTGDRFLLPCQAIASLVMKYYIERGILSCPLSRTVNPQYPKRVIVTAQQQPWAVSWPEYSPPEFTHYSVLENDARIKEGGWADPLFLATPEMRHRFSYLGALPINTQGPGQPCLINPTGRTGVRGRGVLGKWGPNHYATPVITRSNGEGGIDVLGVLTKRADATEEWTLPSSMAPPHDALGAFRQSLTDLITDDETAQYRALLESTWSNGTQISCGYLDDSRNTDNAWMEYLVVHFHLPDELSDKLNLEGSKFKWVHVDESTPEFAQFNPNQKHHIHQSLRLLERLPAQPTLITEETTPLLLHLASKMSDLPSSLVTRIHHQLLPHSSSAVLPVPSQVLSQSLNLSFHDLPCLPISLAEAQQWTTQPAALTIDVRSEVTVHSKHFEYRVDPVEMSVSTFDGVMEKIASGNPFRCVIVCQHAQSQQEGYSFDIGDLARARAVLSALHKRALTRIAITSDAPTPTPVPSPTPTTPAPQTSTPTTSGTPEITKKSSAVLGNLRKLFNKEDHAHSAQPEETNEAALALKKMKEKMAKASQVLVEESNRFKQMLAAQAQAQAASTAPNTAEARPPTPLSAPAYEVVEFGNSVVCVRDELKLSDLLAMDKTAALFHCELVRAKDSTIPRHLVISSQAIIRLMPHREHPKTMGVVETCYPVISLRRLLLSRSNPNLIKFEFAADTDVLGKEKKVGFGILVDEADQLAQLIQRRLREERQRVLQGESDLPDIDALEHGVAPTDEQAGDGTAVDKGQQEEEEEEPIDLPSDNEEIMQQLMKGDDEEIDKFLSQYNN
eukprot:c8320_g1_i1.p1 GENE.c8320_g1_i1~~c8320_g1_i1.p1  ORF type:complete len:1029 (+),score=272.11 c8320_g1_i1:453-3089(+)